MRVLTSEFLKYLRGHPENSILYALEGEELFEWCAVQPLFLKASALRLVSATPGDKTARTLDVKRPAKSPAEVVKLDDKRDFMSGEAFFGIEHCLERSPSPVYVEEEPPAPKVKKVNSKKRMLSSTMISIEKDRSKTATIVKTTKKTGEWSQNYSGEPRGG